MLMATFYLVSVFLFSLYYFQQYDSTIFDLIFNMFAYKNFWDISWKYGDIKESGSIKMMIFTS